MESLQKPIVPILMACTSNGQLQIQDSPSLASGNSNDYGGIVQENPSIPAAPGNLDRERLQKTIENAIGESSQHQIQEILEQVGRLSTLEKLFLYLKLPTDCEPIPDPLRQPLNPLGSRQEISQTIMWIRTHLEEDPELSLPKQDVYSEYNSFCLENKIKPLSTADFGKVMKQVYPKVRPRRLGTRGNSRYCYAGLRKRLKLDAPMLPDFGDRPQSTEALFTQSDFFAAAWTIVKEWAELAMNAQFNSLYELVCYIISNSPINKNSAAALLILSATEDTLPPEALSPLLSSATDFKFKLQKKIQRREAEKEQKRKLQILSIVETKAKPKRSKSEASTLKHPDCTKGSHIKTSDETSNDSNISLMLSPTVRKTSKTSFPAVFSDPVETELNADQKKVKPVLKACKRSQSLGGDPDIKVEPGLLVAQAKTAGKMPIPRLPTKGKPTTPKKLAPSKYKTIQTKLVTSTITSTSATDTLPELQPLSTNTSFKRSQGTEMPTATVTSTSAHTEDDNVVSKFGITRERLESLSSVPKDDLDYVLGGNNSQENEEEMMQIFQPQQAVGDISDAGGNISEETKSVKIQKIRYMLKQKLPYSDNAKKVKVANQLLAAEKGKTRLMLRAQSLDFATNPIQSYNQLISKNPSNAGAVRQVSFENTSSIMDIDSIPSSPNTRRKAFDFTPISPGPLSPCTASQSKCSSANGSPFVSPRNTPVPRVRTAARAHSFVASQATPVTKRVKQETKTCRASAPASPLLGAKNKPATGGSQLLQTLLIARKNYTPNTYDGTSQFSDLADKALNTAIPEEMPTSTNMYRSQSVPLQQMCTLNVQNDQFSFGADGGEELSELGPESIANIISSLEDNPMLNEEPPVVDMNEIVSTGNEIFPYDTQIPSADLPGDAAKTNYTGLPSFIQSDSVSQDLPPLLSKFGQPSRSVPNTPLPNVLSDITANEIDFSNYIPQETRSYPSTPAIPMKENIFSYTGQSLSQDFLINGQPVKTDFAVSQGSGDITSNNNSLVSLDNAEAFPPDYYGSRKTEAEEYTAVGIDPRAISYDREGNYDFVVKREK